MDFSRLIHDYLDGELDNVQQDVLFAELSHNQDLRTDFNQQVKIQMIANTDMMMISPPVISTNAIFSALGFSIPSASYLESVSGAKNNNAGTAIKQRIGKQWSKYVLYLSSFMIIALLSGTTYFAYQYAKGHSKSNDGKTAKSRIDLNNNQQNFPVISSMEKNDNNLNSISEQKFNNNNGNLTDNRNAFSNSNEQGNNQRGTRFNSNSSGFSGNSGINRRNNHSVTDGNYNTGNDKNLSDDASDDSKSVSPVEFAGIFNPSENPDYKANKAFTSLKSNREIIPQSGLYSLTEPTQSFDRTRWSVQTRRLMLRSSNNVNLPSNDNSWNTNMSFSALYKLDNENSIGFEVGKEQFGLVFSNVENGQKYDYIKNPMLWWAGLAWRYSMPEIGIKDILYPYTQVLLGGSTAGVLGRWQLGLNLKPINIIRLDLGIEGCGFGYKVQNTLYSTWKYGFTIGGGLNF